MVSSSAQLAALVLTLAPAGPSAQGSTMPTTKVELTLEANTINPGETVAATVTFSNEGPGPLVLLVPGTFYPDHLVATGPGGDAAPVVAGGRVQTVKTGLYVGHAVRLEPGERRVLRLALALGRQRRLYLAARAPEGEARPPLVSPDELAALGLPAAFPAAPYDLTQALSLPAAGRYRLAWRLAQSEADRGWRLSGGGPDGWEKALWLGLATSAAVELTVP